jgi:hypothetical protein
MSLLQSIIERCFGEKEVSKHNKYIDDKTGDTVESWTFGGYSHREDGPAYIRYNPAGQLISEAWCIGGGLHRTGGPAVITYDPESGAVIEEQWWQHAEKIPEWKKRPVVPLPSQKI